MERTDVIRMFEIIRAKLNLTFDLKAEQIDVITSIVNGKDVFAVLPTGFGKSVCYVLPPLILNQMTGKSYTSLVISPLKALMLQQVNQLKLKGITGYAICESGLDEISMQGILAGKAEVLFASPESILRRKWLDVLKTKYARQICLQAYDEAHCVSEWGLDFRPDYRDIRLLCSLLDAPTLALTATATSAIKKDIYSVLCLDTNTSPRVVAKLPNRPNVFMHCVTAKENFLEELGWLIDCLKAKGIQTPKTLIYCSTIHRCQADFNAILEDLGTECYFEGKVKLENRLIEMFHSATADQTKSRILNEFTSSESKIRVLLATVAFGMGIDIPDVRIVINWGIPRSVLQYWQESGRCARDGEAGLSVCYAFPRSVANCNDSSLLHLKDANSCVRKIVMETFLLDGMDCNVLENLNQDVPLCQGKCEQRCLCRNCSCCTYCMTKCICKAKSDSVIARFL